MILRPDTFLEFITGMMVVDSFRERGGEIKDLILPLIPGSRQDRIKWEGDWLFTLKSVARMINERNFSRVVTIDPHSMASNMIDRLHIVEPRVQHGMRKAGLDPSAYVGVIAPDLGATKRAALVADELGIPVFQATKVRDPETNKLSDFKMIDDLTNFGRYLIVDDICDAGGTFMGLADTIKTKYDVSLHLFVTHGLFTKGFEQLRKRFDKIIATDSVIRHDPALITLPVVDGMVLHV